MNEIGFYETSAKVAFTLLGLWWVVARFRQDEWSRDRAGRRMAMDTSLYFVLPGVMSMLALTAADASVVWRVSFGLASVAGAANAIVSLRASAAGLPGPQEVRFAPAVALFLYGLTATTALAPRLIGDALGLQPLQIEAIAISLLLLLGVGVAWLLLAGPAKPGAQDGNSPVTARFRPTTDQRTKERA